MTAKSLSEADLRQFTGTETWFRHALVPTILYTEGARHVAEHGGAYWLLDEIALAQSIQPVAAEAFQSWKLTVEASRQASLACDDGNGNIVFIKAIPFTDFPLESITFYCTDRVILLPSEY